jgi:hypothetical protein
VTHAVAGGVWFKPRVAAGPPLPASQPNQPRPLPAGKPPLLSTYVQLNFYCDAVPRWSVCTPRCSEADDEDWGDMDLPVNSAGHAPQVRLLCDFTVV